MNGGWVLVVSLCVAAALVFLFASQQGAAADAFVGTIPEYAATTKELNDQLQLAGANPILTSVALDVSQKRLLHQAVAQPDPLLATTPPRDFSPLFVQDPVQVYTRKDNEVCKKASHPNQLPPPSGKVRCGWWYVDDPGTPSVAAIGTYQGPLFPDTVPNGGVWMWNLVEAGKKEDNKRCKRLTMCSLVDAFNEVPGARCGFCPSLGHGVPIDGAGRVVRPEDSGCDAAVATTDRCPAPSEGGGGGSAAAGPTSDGLLSGLCDPRQPNGSLTNECKRAIARQAGMSSQGAFVQHPDNNFTPDQLIASNLLRSYEIQDMYKDPTKLFKWASSIVQAQLTGPTLKIRHAAITLATGTPVDYCPTEASVTGPFDLACMQQLFRQKGCQPAGKRYPVQQDAVNTSMKSWGDLNAEYTGLQAGMGSTDKATQDRSVKECLGITVSRDTMPCVPPTLPSGANNPTLQGFANPSMPTTRTIEGFATEEDKGWHSLDGWCRSVAIGADNILFSIGFNGEAYRRATVDGQWEYLPMSGLNYIDCANEGQVVATSFDGSVFRFKNNTWTRLPLAVNKTAVGGGSPFSCVYATVNEAGRIGLVITNGSYRWLYSTVNDRDCNELGPGDWITYGKGSSATLKASTSEVTFVGARGTSVLPPPPHVRFTTVVCSKSNDRDVLAIATDARLFGLDIHKKWSELLNPHRSDRAGLNGERIVSVISTAPNAGVTNVWTKQIAPTADARGGPAPYVAVPTALYDWTTYHIDYSKIKSPERDRYEAARDVPTSKAFCDALPGCKSFAYGERTDGRRNESIFYNYDDLTGKVRATDPKVTFTLYSRAAAKSATATFVAVPNTVMGGTRTIPYTGKGLEQLKRECVEMAGCVGVNYSATNKNGGTFVLGKETGALAQGAMDGDNLGKSVPILKTVPLATGEQVFLVEDDGYTKLSSSSGVAKFYRGPASAFNPSLWNTYTNNPGPGHYIAMAPPQDYVYYRRM